MMRTIMSRCPHESSLSFSKRHIQWIVSKVTGNGNNNGYEESENEEEVDILTFSFSNSNTTTTDQEPAETKNINNKKKSSQSQIVSVIRSVFTARNRPTKVTGTLFGRRRGHVQIAFQLDSKLRPMVVIELAMPTTTLVREMASGLVRIALECERKGGYTNSNSNSKVKAVKLVEETLWRAYCNGKKCGYAVRRDCGPEDWKVMKAVGPVSMGAGVLPGTTVDDEGEMMYMRARFERVVGSKDSEAFYMMNPDGNSGPELSIYLLRV